MRYCMAITKLSNIKQNSRLYNTIAYIINPSKTKNGLLVGSNAGTDSLEIYQAMQQTKKEYEKTTGRQGYHFIISFDPSEEVTEAQAYQIIETFCNKYLGDDYEFAFSVHDDKDHKHGHIVFNSVSRTKGCKYRYSKGDWQTIIQPLVDEICKEYGVSALQYDPKATKGKHYKAHMSDKDGNSSWRKVYRKDIDFAILKSFTWEDFIQEMKSLDYTIRFGTSVKHNEYALFKLKDSGSKGARDYTLGAGYSISDIKARINNKKQSYVPTKSPTPTRTFSKQMYIKPVSTPLSPYQSIRVHRLFRSANYHQLTSAKVDYKQARKDASKQDALYRQAKYLIKNKIQSEDVLYERRAYLEQEEKRITYQIRDEKALNVKPLEEEYNMLLSLLDAQTLSDITSVLVRLTHLEEEIHAMRQNDALITLQNSLKEIRQEKNLIKQIQKDDTEQRYELNQRKEKEVKHEQQQRQQHTNQLVPTL